MEFIQCKEINGICILQPPTASFYGALSMLNCNRNLVLSKLNNGGIVLLRGFPIHNTDIFKDVILNTLNFEYWYPHKGPVFLLNMIRKYIEKVTGKNDYRNYAKNNTIMLGNAEDSVQGPHTESGPFRVRPKFLAMYCEETSSGAAQTGIYDLNKSYESLTNEEKDFYKPLWNQYIVHTKPLSYFDKIIAKLIFKKHGETRLNKDGSISLFLEKTPLVCKHPEKGILCLQPWAFYNNTAKAVHEAARLVFPDRKNIKQPDRVACSGNSEWAILHNNSYVTWSEEAKIKFFQTIFQTSIIHTWQKGDILILDNIHYGHGRLENNGGKHRKLHQLQVNPIDIMKLALYRD